MHALEENISDKVRSWAQNHVGTIETMVYFALLFAMKYLFIHTMELVMKSVDNPSTSDQVRVVLNPDQNDFLGRKNG